MNFALSMFAERPSIARTRSTPSCLARVKGVGALERPELENSTNVGKALQKLLDPSVIGELLIAAGCDPFNHKVRDPWATPSEFSNQVHRYSV